MVVTLVFPLASRRDKAVVVLLVIFSAVMYSSILILHNDQARVCAVICLIVVPSGVHWTCAQVMLPRGYFACRLRAIVRE